MFILLCDESSKSKVAWPVISPKLLHSLYLWLHWHMYYYINVNNSLVFYHYLCLLNDEVKEIIKHHRESKGISLFGFNYLFWVQTLRIDLVVLIKYCENIITYNYLIRFEHNYLLPFLKKLSIIVFHMKDEKMKDTYHTT